VASLVVSGGIAALLVLGAVLAAVGPKTSATAPTASEAPVERQRLAFTSAEQVPSVGRVGGRTAMRVRVMNPGPADVDAFLVRFIPTSGVTWDDRGGQLRIVGSSLHVPGAPLKAGDEQTVEAAFYAQAAGNWSIVVEIGDATPPAQGSSEYRLRIAP